MNLFCGKWLESEKVRSRTGFGRSLRHQLHLATAFRALCRSHGVLSVFIPAGLAAIEPAKIPLAHGLAIIQIALCPCGVTLSALHVLAKLGHVHLTAPPLLTHVVNLAVERTQFAQL